MVEVKRWKCLALFHLIPLSKLIGNDIIFCVRQGHPVILNGLDFCYLTSDIFWNGLACADCRLVDKSLPCLASRL